MSSRLGHDFRAVRIHTGVRASESARKMRASAYTVGRDIFFGAGQFAPGTERGDRLIAHELTHVAQEDRFGRSGDLDRWSRPSDASEQEAAAVAERAVEGRDQDPQIQVQAPPDAAIAREERNGLSYPDSDESFPNCDEDGVCEAGAEELDGYLPFGPVFGPEPRPPSTTRETEGGSFFDLPIDPRTGLFGPGASPVTFPDPSRPFAGARASGEAKASRQALDLPEAPGLTIPSEISDFIQAVGGFGEKTLPNVGSHSLFGPAMGGFGMLEGIFNFGTGMHQLANAESGADYAQGGMQTGQGVMDMTSGWTMLMDRFPSLGRVTGGISGLLDVGMGINAFVNGDREAQRDGAQQVARGASDSLASFAGGPTNPVGAAATAASIGLRVGEKIVNSTDAHARETGLFGQDEYGNNRTGSRWAADQGHKVKDSLDDLGIGGEQMIGPLTFGDFAGGASTIPLSWAASGLSALDAGNGGVISGLLGS